MRIGIIGVAALDHLLYAGEGASADGAVTFVDSSLECAGGKGLVTALGLRSLGHAPRLLSLVGQDSAVSRLVPGTMRQDFAGILDSDHETWIGITRNLSTRAYVRLGRRLPGRRLPDVAGYVRELDLLFLAHEDPVLISNALEASAALGVETVSNVSTPLMRTLAGADERLIAWMIDGSSALLMNEDESALALHFAGAWMWADVDSSNLREIVVTEGRAGGWTSSRPFRRRHRYPAAPTSQELNPVGAGDTFNAGYLSARYVEGLGALDACKVGARLASEKVATSTSSL